MTVRYPSFVRQLRAAGLRPHCEACAGVRGRETIEIAHPAGRGDPVGLVRAAQGAVGRRRLCAVGDAAAFGAHPGGDRPRRRTRPIWSRPWTAVLRRLGGTARRVAGGSHGHGDRARQRRCAGQLRAGGQALRGVDRAVPAPAGEPQGIGGGRGAFRHGPVVADPGRGLARGRPGEPGPVLVDHRRRPAAQPGPNRGPARRWVPAALADGGRAGRRRAAHGAAGRCRSRPRSRRPHRSTTRPAWRSGGTATRCRPGWPGRR